MSDIDHLSVGPSLVQAGLRDLSLPGKAPRSRKFKEITLGALNQLAIALKEPNESIPEVSGTTAQKRRTYLDYISARLLPRLNEHNDHNDGHLPDNRASSQPTFGSGRPLGGVAGGGGGGAGLAFPTGIARAASVPPRRTQQLLGTAGVVSNAELLSNFVPPLQGETEADYADIIIEVAKELGLVGKGAVTAGGARARLIKYIQKHPRTHVDRDAMWMAVVDQADAQGVQASTPSTLEPWAGDKRVKNISPAFKEVVSKAYTFAAASPDVMETLSQTTIATLHTARSNLEPSLSALVLNEPIHDQLAGKVALVVKLLFRLSVSCVESGLFPISFRSHSSLSSRGKDSVYKAAATARVRSNFDFSTWYSAFYAMASRDQRRQKLADLVPSTQWKSSQFPRSECLWSDLQAFLNHPVPVTSHKNLGNVVSIAIDLTQRGMATEQVATLMDAVFVILAQEVEEVKLGQRTSLPEISPIWSNNTFAAQLQGLYDEGIRAGEISASIQAFMTPNSGGSGGGQGPIATLTRDTGGAGRGGDAGASAGRTDPAAAAPEVSSKFNLTSSELSAEGLLQHSQNGRGMAPVLRAATLLKESVPARVCARHLLFGSCTVTDCSFDHSPTPWPDDKRLRVLRKARDIIVAGQSRDSRGGAKRRRLQLPQSS